MDGIFERNGEFERSSKNKTASFSERKFIHGWQSKWVGPPGIYSNWVFFDKNIKK